MEIWAVLDKWNHRLRLPKRLSLWICDKYDLALGLSPAEIKREQTERKKERKRWLF